MKIILYKNLLLLTLLVIQLQVKAQVTIGSKERPSQGAILDLKEYDINGQVSNSSRGMMLPRVNLTSKTNLFPMFSGDPNYENNITGKKDSEDLLHIGLIVYNMKEDLCENIYKGASTWDGAQWQAVGKVTFPSKTNTLVDTRNPAKTENYQIGEFGEAGWWMLENLRAERWPDGTTGVFKEPGKFRPVYNPRYYEPMFWYPKLDRNSINTHPEYGYVYNGWAVLRTSFDNMLAGTPTTGIQGICPAGWHVPTRAEWKQLATAIASNVCQYTQNGSAANLDYNLLAQGELPLASSRSRLEGGFNAHLLGYVTNTGTVNSAPDYDYVGMNEPEKYPEYVQRTNYVGQIALYWASDTTDDSLVPSSGSVIENLWGFATYINGSVNFNGYGKISYSTQLPVRCKKDGVARSTNSTSETNFETIEVL